MQKQNERMRKKVRRNATTNISQRHIELLMIINLKIIVFEKERRRTERGKKKRLSIRHVQKLNSSNISFNPFVCVSKNGMYVVSEPHLRREKNHQKSSTNLAVVTSNNKLYRLWKYTHRSFSSPHFFFLSFLFRKR